MRSILFFLFAVIAGSMLSVCAIPVPGPGDPAQKGVKRPRESMTIGEETNERAQTFRVKHEENASKAKQQRKLDKGSITFVDRQGQKTTGTPQIQNYKFIIFNVLTQIEKLEHVDVINYDKSSSCVPEVIPLPAGYKGRSKDPYKVFYFKLKGLYEKCRWEDSGSRGRNKVYVGIYRRPSPGAPSPGGWEKVVIFDAAQEKPEEWEFFSEHFENNFMVPPNEPELPSHAEAASTTGHIPVDHLRTNPSHSTPENPHTGSSHTGPSHPTPENPHTNPSDAINTTTENPNIKFMDIKNII
ncbi:hypothetical protein BDP27DRAFT_1451525 [Rhodocollybia butyracea]|uniref:Uncharacterized protein n=1 Tax=Rhodocollybia butyracea TaxID=206335 RepID=A0A9P5PD36_9AGAR|nr:hypothetical protein BDP27DRAFT_1451525 [Rhodocollybia butyracea]